MANYQEQVWEITKKWQDRSWPVSDNNYDNVLFTFKSIIMNHIPIQMLLASYSTEKRRYHNVNHLWDMISLGTHTPSFSPDIDPLGLVIAIAGHDFVYEYDSVATENEVMSAVRTASFFELKPQDAHTVGHAIFATAKHAEDLTKWATPFEQELLDRDLFSFAKPYEAFKKNSLDVVEEIFCAAGEACKPKSREEIMKGQCAFFDLLLMVRPTIYYRHTEWESQARKNLVQYVKEIRDVS